VCVYKTVCSWTLRHAFTIINRLFKRKITKFDHSKSRQELENHQNKKSFKLFSFKEFILNVHVKFCQASCASICDQNVCYKNICE